MLKFKQRSFKTVLVVEFKLFVFGNTFAYCTIGLFFLRVDFKVNK